MEKNIFSFSLTLKNLTGEITIEMFVDSAFNGIKKYFTNRQNKFIISLVFLYANLY